MFYSILGNYYKLHHLRERNLDILTSLTNALGTFQGLMNQIFHTYLRKFVLVFVDDILIYSRSEEDHWLHLQQVLGSLAEHQFCVNIKKCFFGQTRLENLEHWISHQGVSTDSSKVDAIQGWLVLQNVRQLWVFLGLAGYYGRFVAG